jgi:hypothetical protein
MAGRRFLLIVVALGLLLAACGRRPYVAPDDFTGYYISVPEQEYIYRFVGVSVTEDPASLDLRYHDAALFALNEAEHACSRFAAGEGAGLANELDADTSAASRSAALRLERFEAAVELLCPKLDDELRAFYADHADIVARARLDT